MSIKGLGRVSRASSMVGGSILESIDVAGVALPRERFVAGVTDLMLCMVCEKVTPDPVYLLCHHNNIYCFKCVTWEKGDPPTILCPTCNVPVPAKTLTRNDNLRSAIYALKVTCEYKPQGCTKLCTVDTLSDHMDHCQYQPLTCENIGCKEQCLLKDWVWHCKVNCPKRKVQCVGSCQSMISAEDVDTHDCDHVLKDLVKYQHDEIEVLSQLFKDQHIQHVTSCDILRPDVDDLSRRISERLIMRKASNALPHKCRSRRLSMILNEDDSVHDNLGHERHRGKWRCSVLECLVPYAKHNYDQPFPDKARHIFFWDCCLDGNAKSTKCDVFDV